MNELKINQSQGSAFVLPVTSTKVSPKILVTPNRSEPRGRFASAVRASFPVPLSRQQPEQSVGIQAHDTKHSVNPGIKHPDIVALLPFGLPVLKHDGAAIYEFDKSVPGSEYTASKIRENTITYRPIASHKDDENLEILPELTAQACWANLETINEHFDAERAIQEEEVLTEESEKKDNSDDIERGHLETDDEELKRRAAEAELKRNAAEAALKKMAEDDELKRVEETELNRRSKEAERERKAKQAEKERVKQEEREKRAIEVENESRAKDKLKRQVEIELERKAEENAKKKIEDEKYQRKKNEELKKKIEEEKYQRKKNEELKKKAKEIERKRRVEEKQKRENLSSSSSFTDSNSESSDQYGKSYRYPRGGSIDIQQQCQRLVQEYQYQMQQRQQFLFQQRQAQFQQCLLQQQLQCALQLLLQRYQQQQRPLISMMPARTHAFEANLLPQDLQSESSSEDSDSDGSNNNDSEEEYNDPSYDVGGAGEGTGSPDEQSSPQNSTSPVSGTASVERTEEQIQENFCTDYETNLEDGVGFKFNPRADCATEVTLTVEPRRPKPWQTMMNCGFRPMIQCPAAPYNLQGPGAQQYMAPGCSKNFYCQPVCPPPQTQFPYPNPFGQMMPQLQNLYAYGQSPYLFQQPQELESDSDSSSEEQESVDIKGSSRTYENQGHLNQQFNK